MSDLSLPVVAQVIGVIALCFGVLAFQTKEDKRLKIFLILQSISLATHFYLLGAQGGATAASISFTRNVCAMFARLRHVAPLFIATYIVFGIINYERWVDVLPIMSAMFSTTAMFYLRGIPMRLFFLCSTILWLTHNAVVGSIGPFFMEVIIFFSNGYTILSLFRAKAQQAKLKS